MTWSSRAARRVPPRWPPPPGGGAQPGGRRGARRRGWPGRGRGRSGTAGPGRELHQQPGGDRFLQGGESSSSSSRRRPATRRLELQAHHGGDGQGPVGPSERRDRRRPTTSRTPSGMPSSSIVGGRYHRPASPGHRPRSARWRSTSATKKGLPSVSAHTARAKSSSSSASRGRRPPRRRQRPRPGRARRGGTAPRPGRGAGRPEVAEGVTPADLAVPVGAPPAGAGARRSAGCGAAAAASAWPPSAGRRARAARAIPGTLSQPGGHGVEEAVALGLRIGPQRRGQAGERSRPAPAQAGQLPAVAAQAQLGGVVRVVAERLDEGLVGDAEVLVAAAAEDQGTLAVERAASWAPGGSCRCRAHRRGGPSAARRPPPPSTGAGDGRLGRPGRRRCGLRR